MTSILHLPWPPSANRAIRVGRNRKTGKRQMYPNEDYQRFFEDAKILSAKYRPEKVAGPFTYHLILNRNLRHGNADGENRIKYCVDYAQKIGVIENDKLAEGGSWSWGVCEYGALLSIHPVACVESKSSPSNDAAGKVEPTKDADSYRRL